MMAAHWHSYSWISPHFGYRADRLTMISILITGFSSERIFSNMKVKR